MATAQFHFDDFQDRLIKAGLQHAVSMVVMQEEETNLINRLKVRIEVVTKPYNHAHCLAVMGLIAHFCNRLWAKHWEYLYIMQSHHVVVFTDGDDEEVYLIVDKEDGGIFKRSDLVHCRQWILNKFERGDFQGYRLITEKDYKSGYPHNKP